MALADLLQKAKPRPEDSDCGGPTLALALHCLMVQHGYQSTHKSSRNPYVPSPDWNSKFKDEWMFEYTRRGCKNGYQLHCSLQAATGKMFVQCREKDVSGNVQILGVQVENYITRPDGKLKWQEMLKSEDVLQAMFKEHIIDELAKHTAELDQGGGQAAYDWLHRTTEALQQRDAFVPIGIVLSAAIVASVAFYFHRRAKQR